MSEGKKIAPVAIRFLASVLAVIGFGYMLLPFQALRPDGVLAAHPQATSLRVLMLMHPVLGVAMVLAAILVWRRFTTAVLVCFWILVALVVAGAPLTMHLLIYYGK